MARIYTLLPPLWQVSRQFFKSGIWIARLSEEHTTPGKDDEGGASNDNSCLLYISYKTAQDLLPMNSFTDLDYFTAAFPSLFPFSVSGHLGDANGNRLEEVSLKAFAKYAMLHYSLL
jgi:hypothetical protein